jgi:MFS family permease
MMMMNLPHLLEYTKYITFTFSPVTASIPYFTHGLQTTELFASSHAGHFIRSPEAVPWNSTALVLAAAISGPVHCYLIDRFGRKVGVFLVILIQGVS